MELREYIKGLGKAGLDAFAAKCGTTAGHLKQVAYGHRRAAAGLAVCIERETCQSVVCESLRPDIDWAYLRSKPEAA